MYICISASLVASFIVHCLTAESLYPASLRGEQSIGGDWFRLHDLYLLFFVVLLVVLFSSCIISTVKKISALRAEWFTDR